MEIDDKKVKERKVPVELKTSLSGLGVDPERGEIPVYVMGDRLILEYMPPSEKLESSIDIYRSPSEKSNFAKGRIVNFGDSSDPLRQIPEVLRKIGLIVRYSKNMAETFEWQSPDGEKKTYHMIRSVEVMAIL